MRRGGAQDLRLMVSGCADGFKVVGIYGRKAPRPLEDKIAPGTNSWLQLGTNLSVKLDVRPPPPRIHTPRRPPRAGGAPALARRNGGRVSRELTARGGGQGRLRANAVT